jgi:phosphinothricin acetyltransferase
MVRSMKRTIGPPPEVPARYNIEIVSLKHRDWPAVRRIYLQGIATGHGTFETKAPGWKTWDAAHRRDVRLVARDGEEVLGWAVLSPVSARKVYAGVAEVSIYVAEGARGRGVGRTLLEALIRASESAGLWTLQAGIFPENEASLALHRRCGFRLVGVRKRIGRAGCIWRDVCLLERRSPSDPPAISEKRGRESEARQYPPRPRRSRRNNRRP